MFRYTIYKTEILAMQRDTFVLYAICQVFIKTCHEQDSSAIRQRLETNPPNNNETYYTP